MRGNKNRANRSAELSATIIMSWISCALAFLCLATALCAAPVAAERTNYCDRAAAVANGSMLIKDALVGEYLYRLALFRVLASPRRSGCSADFLPL